MASPRWIAMFASPVTRVMADPQSLVWAGGTGVPPVSSVEKRAGRPFPLNCRPSYSQATPAARGFGDSRVTRSVMRPCCQVGRGLRTRRPPPAARRGSAHGGQAVAPYLLSHIGPGYSRNTPANARVQRLKAYLRFASAPSQFPPQKIAPGTARSTLFLRALCALCG